MRRYLVLTAVALAVVGTVFLASGPAGKGSIARPAGAQCLPVLSQLGPGTTLHTIFLQYRRHGPAEEVMLSSDSYLPEHYTVEGWLTFDETGALSSLRGETRGLDGALYQIARSDGDDLVHSTPDGAGAKRFAGPLRGFTIDAYVATMSELCADAARAMEAQPDARLEMLGSVEVQVLEFRKAFTPRPTPVPSDPEHGLSSSGYSYSVPYVTDLAPVEKIRRHYMSLTDQIGVRYESVVVDANGRETVVESKEQLLMEVLTP